MPGPTRLPDLLPRFGLAPGRPAPELPLPGSPERAIERFAVTDATGRLWMLERISPGQAARREALGGLLAALARDPAMAGDIDQDVDMAALIPAYRPVTTPQAAPDAANLPAYVLHQSGPPHAGLWQLSPHVAGIPLPRPDYLDHAWRGQALGRALSVLQRAGAALPALPQAPRPSLAEYRDDFFRTVARHAPRLLPRLAPVRRILAPLAEALAACPSALAHGDPHPLNVIWGQKDDRPLRALIDWEFAGARPRLYDAAVVLGCAGFEHPSGLSRGFALAFVRALKEGDLPSRELRTLPLVLVAVRLGWLSEWLRKNDVELLDLELDYLDILIDAQEALAKVWSEA